MSTLNPWKVLVKHWKKDEYLSQREIFIWNLLNYLLTLPTLILVYALLHYPAKWAFILWLATVGIDLLLSRIPRVRARRVKLLNRRVDKKKSRTLPGA